MWLVGVVLLTVSNEASRSVIEGAFAHASVLFADNVRILATATVILAAFVALRCGARARARGGGGGIHTRGTAAKRLRSV